MSTDESRRGINAWMNLVPIPSGLDRHNALMLLTTLAAIGAASLAMVLLPSSVTGQIDLGGTWIAPAIFGYVSLCLVVFWKGLYSLAAGLVVAGSLLLISGSYYSYGLQVQPGLMLVHMMPLLLAALLLGRAAVWWSVLGSIAGMVLGTWVDIRHAPGGGGAGEALSNLLMGSMNHLILAGILDRLILSSKRTLERNRELDTLCRRLELEMAEKELAYARLLQTQRMEAIGRLSTGVAHDFGNILNVIIGLVTSADMKGRTADAALPGIHRAAQRGTVLTRRLLSFSRTQTRQTTVFDLAETIEEMRGLMSPMFHRGITVRIEPSPAGLLVELDRDELELAFLNIASNACDAMPQNGCFMLSSEASDGHAVIRMSDTGTGMSGEVRARLFEPFFTTKPKGEGTGIGMAIVHRFITDSGGSIEVDSTPGHGTTILLRLPLVTHARGRAGSGVAAQSCDEQCNVEGPLETVRPA